MRSRLGLIGAAAWCAIATLCPVFGALLVRTGPELQVNTYTSDHQIRAAVAADAGGDSDFVVASSKGQYQDGNNWGVFRRRFDSAGVALGGELAVNTFTSGFQDRKGITADAAGSFVIVWGSRAARTAPVPAFSAAATTRPAPR